MERIDIKYKDAKKALLTLGEIQKETFSLIVRDAAIQRFEYSFEAVWKFLKEYLKTKHGLICNSPKACFKELFSLGLLTEDESVQCMEMTDRRNETSHTYKEEVSKIIYGKIKEYHQLMEYLLKKLENQ